MLFFPGSLFLESGDRRRYVEVTPRILRYSHEAKHFNECYIAKGIHHILASFWTPG